MEIKVLTEQRKISGIDPFGRRSKLIFCPNDKVDTKREKRNAILWHVPEDHIPKTIGSSLAVCRPRRIALVHGTHSLEIIEHILPLRWFGVLGLIIEGSGWPPYFGRAWEFYDGIHSSLEKTGQKILWITTRCPIAFSHRDALGGMSAFTPSTSPGLHIKIVVNFPDLGQYELLRSIPEDLHQIKKDMEAYTPGMPHWAYYPSLFGKKLRVWKHHDEIAWSHSLTPELALQEFAKHRLIDFLGTLALVNPVRLLAGSVESVHGGHESDLRLVREIQKKSLKIDSVSHQ